MNKGPNFDSRQMLEPLPEYSSLGLTHNPFLASGLAPDVPLIAPFPEIRDKIQHFIHSFIRSKQSQGMIILGDYGTGKTYHLRYIESKFKEYGPRLKTVFVATPGVEPYDVIRAILAQIGDEQVAKAVWTLIAPALRKKIASEGQAYFKRLLRDFPPSRRKDVQSIYQTSFDVPLFVDLQEDTLTDHRRFLNAFDKHRILSREKLRDNLAPILYRQDGELPPITTNPAIARELASTCLYDGAPALESWERLTTAGSRKKTLPPRQEAEFLQAILRLLLATKVEYFVLLLDEFEKVPLMQLMTAREAKQYLDAVRMLIDSGWQQLPFAYVFASHDEAWDLVKAEIRALTERFPMEVPLPRLDDVSLARQLLSDLLDLARERLSREVNIAPFPPTFFEIVPPQYRNTPRDLIILCYDLIEQAADRELSTVPEQLIKDYLESYIIPEESEAEDAT